MNPCLRPVLPILSCLLLAGCATTSESGRSRVLAPTEIGAVYSEVEVQTRLAFTPDASCEPDCSAAEAFRDQIWRLAQRLDPEVRRLGVEREIDVPLFNVTVPAKDDIGTLSSGAGNIIVFDGLRQIGLAEPALAFLLAREMGHIIANHHEENTATGLAISVAVAILFPVAGLLQGAEIAYAATTLPMGLASTALSFAGSRAMRALYRDDQRREADTYALLILARAGWTPYAVAAALQDAEPRIGEDGWMGELRGSKIWLDQMTMGPTQMMAATSFEAERVAEPQSPPHTTAQPPVVMETISPVSTKPPPQIKPVLTNKPEAQGKMGRTCTTRLVRGVKKIICTALPAKKPVRGKTPAPAAKGALSRR